MIQQPDRRAALQILHSLAESGQPPKLGALYLNVGTDRMLERLRVDYLDDVLRPYEGQDGFGACRWVEANYGNGKTQFLRCVQELAWELDYVTAFVELSQDECPLDHPERVYGAVARALQARPLTPSDVDRSRGIETTLAQLVDRRFDGVFSGMPDDEKQERARVWIESTLRHTPVESTAFRTAAVQHLLAKLRGDEEQAQLTAIYLRGEPVPPAQLKPLGIFEKLDKASGFRMLRSLCQLLQRSGLATGTVLLFDEARRSLSLMSSKAQKIACENLLSVINRCNSGELAGTLFLYAVMPEFFTDFAAAYPALQQRCGPSTRLDLEAIGGISESELLRQIGDRITDLFKVAHGDMDAPEDLLAQHLQQIVGLTLEETMVGSGVRRLFVRSWTQALQQLRDRGGAGLTEDELRQAVGGAREQLSHMEADSVSTMGE